MKIILLLFAMEIKKNHTMYGRGYARYERMSYIEANSEQ